METYQEEVEPQIPPLPPGFVLEDQLAQSPPGNFVPEESLIQRADRAAFETLLGPAEGAANIGLGIAGWAGGTAYAYGNVLQNMWSEYGPGFGKLLYDTWRSGGKNLEGAQPIQAWQDFEADFRSAAGIISSLGGLYQPQTQMGQDIARLAGMSIEKADTYWKNIVDKLTDDPEKNAALKAVGGTAVAILMGKFMHKGYKIGKAHVKETMIPPKPSQIATPQMQAGRQFIQNPEVVKELTTAIRGLKPLMAEQKVSWGKQYARKFARSEQAYKMAGGGRAGANAAQRAMGGKMERTLFDYKSILGKFTPEAIDYFYHELMSSPLLTQGQKLTAKEGGLDIIFNPKGTNLPQGQALYYLSRVFGKDFVSAIRKNWDTWSKVKHHGFEVVNIPRSLKASFDASAPFRQGLFLIGRKEFWSSFREMFKLMEGKGNYEALMGEIAGHENFGLAKAAGLEITEMPSKSGTLVYKPKGKSRVLEQILEEGGKDIPKLEEQFFSQLAEKIPGVGWSGRVYTGFLNKLRFDTFNALLKDAEKWKTFKKLGKDPKSDPHFVKSIASFINSATGRGKLKARDIHSFVNTFFFSPKLLKSRFDMLANPKFYKDLHPYARKQAVKSVLSVVGAGVTIAGLLREFGLADVETDPVSAGFMKIRPKGSDTWIDIWGGNQQFVVPVARMLLNEFKSTTTGKKKKLGEGYKGMSRYDVALQFGEYKESPPFSFLTRMLKGKDIKGDPVKIENELGEMVYPLFLKDIYDIAQEDPDLLPLGILGGIGFGLQSYPSKKQVVR
jgi:hypothetical protein